MIHILKDIGNKMEFKQDGFEIFKGFYDRETIDRCILVDGMKIPLVVSR